jgi:hypothetical protein
MRIRRVSLVISMITLLALLAACAPATPAAPAATATQAATDVPTEAPAPTESPTVEATEVPEATEEPTAEATEETSDVEVPEGALVSVAAEEAPELDGAADDAAWEEAPVVEIPVTGGANESDTTVMLQSVHSGDMVYFLLTWADPTESFIRAPWEKQADGTWMMVEDPDDRGGDNNTVYEDKFSFIWNINDSIQGFEQAGCFGLCHAGENSDVKPYGNKYTQTEGEIGDIWHWKSVRNLNQVDDQYVDHTRYSADTPGAGRKSDPKTTDGYVDNVTEDKTLPAFMPPDGGAKDGSPGYILDEEKVPFDDALFEAGDRVPSIVKSAFEGDRGDISAAWQYADGTWTLELGRKLTTGSEFDVQFDDLAGTYHFGIAVFDNAQVRHAFQAGVTPFVFQE